MAQNGSVFTVKRGDIQRLHCKAHARTYLSIIVDTAHQPTAFTEYCNRIIHNKRIHTHFFSITDSGMILIHGLNRATQNTDYTIVLYFNGEYLYNYVFMYRSISCVLKAWQRVHMAWVYFYYPTPIPQQRISTLKVCVSPTSLGKLGGSWKVIVDQGGGGGQAYSTHDQLTFFARMYMYV